MVMKNIYRMFLIYLTKFNSENNSESNSESEKRLDLKLKIMLPVNECEIKI